MLSESTGSTQWSEAAFVPGVPPGKHSSAVWVVQTSSHPSPDAFKCGGCPQSLTWPGRGRASPVQTVHTEELFLTCHPRRSVFIFSKPFEFVSRIRLVTSHEGDWRKLLSITFTHTKYIWKCHISRAATARGFLPVQGQPGVKHKHVVHHGNPLVPFFVLLMWKYHQFFWIKLNLEN